MKLKNITLAFAAAILSLTGCVNEDLAPSNAVVDGLPTSLNLTFTTEEVTTKAPTAHDDYEFATDEEIQINTLAVAVFKVNTNNSVGGLLGFKYFSAANAGELTPITDTTHGVPGYQVSGIPAETGKVKILAIANPGISKADLETASATYTAFKALAESYTNGTAPAYGFVANNLVKFRELETTLSTATNTTPIHIELVQLAARIDVGINIINAVAEGKWTFTMSSYEVTGINASSKIFLGDDISTVTNSTISNPLVKIPRTTQSLEINSTDNGAMSPKYAFSFYTYEKLTQDSPININITGTLQDQGQPEENKMFRIVLNPVKVDGDPKKQTNGVAHGNVYTVIGSIDARLKTINFAYAVIPWQGVHETEVNIKPIYYLLVKDLYMSMPNMTDITTTFESSSPVTIINPKTFVVGESGNVQDGTAKATITPSASNNGTISIYSAIPTNFVPRKITFTVRNANGLTQDVEIIQYPPLYITFEKSGSTGSGDNGQTNYNYYKFTSLVANYSLFPYPDEFYETFPSGYTHYGRNETLGKSYTDYIRGNAILGFPSMSGSGNTALTVDSDENNRMISPNFMLASQAGIISATNYTSQRNRCRDYTEIRVVNGQNVTLNDWRMPTLAEVYVIDILQNVQACVVKKILEGQYYWSSRESQTITFMDPRVDAGGGATSGAVRCVRDLK